MQKAFIANVEAWGHLGGRACGWTPKELQAWIEAGRLAMRWVLEQSLLVVIIIEMRLDHTPRQYYKDAMGRAKQWAIEQAEQGFNSKDTRVCTQCVDDYALIEYINRDGDLGHRCSYCDRDSQRVKTVSFDDFVRRVLKGIQTEWGDPNNEGVGWEQGWVGDVTDSYDILSEELDISFATDDLFQDIQSSLSDHQWCQRNFYELEPHQALTAGWEEFAKVVKHESRYGFFRRDDPRAQARGVEEIAPADFLDALSSVISDCRLYKKLPAGTIVSRLRIHAIGCALSTAQELGPPPPALATLPNRMSAAGISVFYGAFDKETAIAETATSTDEPKGATLGHFKLLKNLNVVDFTKLPPVPSIFELGSRSRRHGIRFLMNFLHDFTSPVEKDGREHIKYVPTQVVAEYLRFVHRDTSQRKIDGILYKSARQECAEACVLFFGPEGVCDPGVEESKKIAVLQSVETFELAKADSK